jgi:hypothetical protein
MVDKNDPKDLNQKAPTEPQVRREDDQIAEKDLEKVSGGAIVLPGKGGPGKP